MPYFSRTFYMLALAVVALLSFFAGELYRQHLDEVLIRNAADAIAQAYQDSYALPAPTLDAESDHQF